MADSDLYGPDAISNLFDPVRELVGVVVPAPDVPGPGAPPAGRTAGGDQDAFSFEDVRALANLPNRIHIVHEHIVQTVDKPAQVARAWHQRVTLGDPVTNLLDWQPHRRRALLLNLGANPVWIIPRSSTSATPASGSFGNMGFELIPVSSGGGVMEIKTPSALDATVSGGPASEVAIYAEFDEPGPALQ